MPKRKRTRKRTSVAKGNASIEFGERIRQIRLEHRATQQEVGAALGVAHSYISGVELGVLAPFLPHRLQRFASHFECDFDELQELAIQQQRSLKVPLKRHTPEVNQAIYMLAGALESQQIKPSDGRKLLAYVKRLTR